MIQKFQEKFKTIVFYKGEVSRINDNIKTLSRYDKNGSHSRAIVMAQDEKRKKVAKFNELLGGFTYEEWLERSKKVSYLKSKIRIAKASAEKYEAQLEAFISII